VSVPVPLGQYYPADSIIHHLDARAKIGLATVFSVMLFTVDSWQGLLGGALLTALAIAASRVPLHVVVRGVRPVAFLLVLTVALNALRWRPDEALWQLGPLALDAEGLAQGLYFATRIVLLVLGTTLVTFTTSPVALTDGLARLMRPLRAVRVPVDDVAMMLTVALRFIPATAEEADTIIVAQTARGAVFDRGGPIARAKAYGPVLVPLFVALFRRADELAVAMESRCYRGQGRTRMTEPRLNLVDVATLVLAGAVMLAVALRY